MQEVPTERDPHRFSTVVGEARSDDLAVTAAGGAIEGLHVRDPSPVRGPTRGARRCETWHRLRKSSTPGFAGGVRRAGLRTSVDLRHRAEAAASAALSQVRANTAMLAAVWALCAGSIVSGHISLELAPGSAGPSARTHARRDMCRTASLSSPPCATVASVGW